MIKCSVFMAISLDGFIAKEDGDVAWLDNPKYTLDSSEDFGYYAFMDSVDYLVMGRNTFDFVKDFRPWPYSKKVFVFTRSLKEIPQDLEGKVELFSGDISELIEKFEKEKVKRLYIDGGKVVQSFFNQQLITDLTLNVIPIILGKGIPLFANIHKECELEHIKTKTYPNGFVENTYHTIYS